MEAIQGQDRHQAIATGERTAGATTTYFQWDGDFGLVREDTLGIWRNYMGRGGDLSGVSPATGDARYYLTDHLGSVRRIVDANGATVATGEYATKNTQGYMTYADSKAH